MNSASTLAVVLLACAACSAAAEKVLLTSGPDTVNLQLANVGQSPAHSKLLGSVKLSTTRSGTSLYSAVAGSLAFTIGVNFEGPPETKTVGKTYVTVTNIAGNTPKVVTIGYLPELYNKGPLAGCPAAAQGALTVIQTGNIYSLYFSTACLYKCSVNAGIDRGYIVQYSYNANTRQFSGLKPTKYLYQSNPKCVANAESTSVADIRTVGGKLYALLQTEGAGIKLVKVSNGRLSTVFTGAKCGNEGLIVSGTAFYSACYVDNATKVGVVLSTKGSNRTPVLGGKYSSAATTFSYFGASTSRLFTIQGDQKSQANINQSLVAHALTGSLSTPLAKVLPLPKLSPSSSWNDVDVI